MALLHERRKLNFYAFTLKSHLVVAKQNL